MREGAPRNGTGLPPCGRRIPLCLPGVGQRAAGQKSTTYTVLKKLCERGILHNANGTVTALVKQAQVQQEESAAVVQKSFGGSLPRFVAAFLNTSSISEEEAAAIRAMLDDARRQDSDA